MGSETENGSSYTPKLPLLSASHAHMRSPERSGMLTPPFYSSASVPFLWEEEPGKPKPCTVLTTFSSTPNESAQKCLELPPRLLLMDSKVTKLSSPTTVLEGPYMGRARFQSSSSRMGSESYGSFRSAAACDGSPEMGQLGSMVLSKRGYKEKGFLGSWRRKALKSRPNCNSYVFASSGDREGEDSNGTKITRIRRIGSFPSLSRSKSHFWESVCEGFMQVVPWSKRENKDRFKWFHGVKGKTRIDSRADFSSTI